MSNTFISKHQAEIGKKIKQMLSNKHPEDEFLLYDSYFNSSSNLPSKNNRKYSKK